MDPTEKSEMSRRDASTKDGYVSIYGYTCMRKKRERERKWEDVQREPPARDVLFRSNGPAAIIV